MCVCGCVHDTTYIVCSVVLATLQVSYPSKDFHYTVSDHVHVGISDPGISDHGVHVGI